MPRIVPGLHRLSKSIRGMNEKCVLRANTFGESTGQQLLSYSADKNTSFNNFLVANWTVRIQNPRTISIICCNYYTFIIEPKKLSWICERKVCIKMFIVALSTIVKNWEQL